jgi:hypothetical protein
MYLKGVGHGGLQLISPPHHRLMQIPTIGVQGQELRGDRGSHTAVAVPYMRHVVDAVQVGLALDIKQFAPLASNNVERVFGKEEWDVGAQDLLAGGQDLVGGGGGGSKEGFAVKGLSPCTST